MIDENNIKTIIHKVINKHGGDKRELITILTEINQKLGYLPKEAITEISIQLGIPKSQIYSDASFYSMLHTKPMGRHVIKFCESAPCYVEGGREVWAALKKTINLEPGETSPDGKWTLTTTSCLGLCDIGPVMMVDEDIYSKISPETIPDILSRYK
ncbi:MAG TPA: NADH-quinone oxidoreductase subunit NuoE [Anaerolineae bacterium]|nr:NADH-quinone oxidoreductase subunit NuoE [Anaerolineae bacterium]